MNRAQQMPPKTKQIVNGAMHEEKMLGVARRFESAHLAFLLARRLMRHFGSVVCPFILTVADTGQEIPARCPIAAQFVGYQPARDAR
jgi:hypothetical protein